jgi:hypothetical protein
MRRSRLDGPERGDFAQFSATLRLRAKDLERTSEELLAGLTGSGRSGLAAADAVSLRMAPLTHDRHFYVDQGANARVRVVLMTIGRRLAQEGFLTEADNVMYLTYDELRFLIGDPAGSDVRGTVTRRRAERDAAYQRRPRDWISSTSRTGSTGDTPTGSTGPLRWATRSEASVAPRVSSKAWLGWCAASMTSTTSLQATSSSAR